MGWVEVENLPKECRNCTEEDCYQCDIAGKRWVLAKKDHLLNNRAIMVRAIQRLQRKIAIIDAELEKMQ